MKSYKKPPQGTNKIISRVKQEQGRLTALKLLDDVEIFVVFRNEYPDDPDFRALLEMKAEGMLSDDRASTHLIALNEKYSRGVVGRLYRHIKFSPCDHIAKTWALISS